MESDAEGDPNEISREDYIFKFNILRRTYARSGEYKIPENIEDLPLEELEKTYRELVDRIGADRKAKLVDTIKDICKIIGRDHPKELDDSKYVETATEEEIEQLCLDKGIDLDQITGMYSILGTVAFASRGQDGCCIN